MRAAAAKLLRELPIGAVVIDYVGPSSLLPRRRGQQLQQRPGGMQEGEAWQSLIPLVKVTAPVSWSPQQVFHIWVVRAEQEEGVH